MNLCLEHSWCEVTKQKWKTELLCDEKTLLYLVNLFNRKDGCTWHIPVWFQMLRATVKMLYKFLNYIRGHCNCYLLFSMPNLHFLNSVQSTVHGTWKMHKKSVPELHASNNSGQTHLGSRINCKVTEDMS